MNADGALLIIIAELKIAAMQTQQQLQGAVEETQRLRAEIERITAEKEKQS